ncbi:hypothetical protein CR513_32496, partial [Mucuna pruriens]
MIQQQLPVQQFQTQTTNLFDLSLRGVEIPTKGRARNPPAWMKDAIKFAMFASAGVKWIFKTKLKEIREIDKFKVRLVVEGYTQEKGIDYREIFSPITRLETIRTIVALAATKRWNNMIYTSNHESMFQEFKTVMMNEFVMTELGKMRYFLGIEVLQGCSGIFIGQKKYIKDILDKFNMLDCNLVKNPIILDIKLLKIDKGAKIDSTLLKQLVRSLMYLMATRLDIAHSISLINSFMEHPKDKHFLATKRILKYLQGTQNLRIFYKARGNEELLAYTDSDYAGDPNNRKSTSGYAFMLGGGMISWASKKQSIISLSTTGA